MADSGSPKTTPSCIARCCERAAEKNGDPTRESVMESGAARPKEYLILYIRATRTRAARRGVARRGRTRCSNRRLVSHRVRVRAVWETAPRRDTDRERETRQAEENEEEEEGTARRRKRKRERLGEVAFNQSPASKCTVHVYVYTAG